MKIERQTNLRSHVLSEGELAHTLPDCRTVRVAAGETLFFLCRRYSKKVVDRPVIHCSTLIRGPGNGIAVRRRTRDAIGFSVNLHRFRHAAVTFWSIHDPKNVRGAKDLLGHASFSTTEKHYIMDYGAVSNSGPNVESNCSSITAFSSLSLASSAASRARAVSWAGRVVAGSFAEGSDKAF